MPRLKRLGVYIIDVVRVENARFRAAENGLFAWGIGEAETSPTRQSMSIYGIHQWRKMKGAHTLASY